jgi:excisionase family DNA binding protein
MHSSSKNSSKKFNIALSTCRKVALFSSISARYLTSIAHLKDWDGGVFEYRRAGTIMLLRIQEACQYLAVSRSTLYRLIEEGKLKRVYLRGAPRITESSLVRLAGESNG